MTEHKLQIALNAFLRLALPADAFLTSIDHARKQSAEAGMFQKMRGIRAGIPDMVIVYRGVAHWLEIKTDMGVVSPAQKIVHEEIVRAGGRVAVVHSVTDVESVCRYWGIPLRATTLTAAERDARLANAGNSSKGARPRQAKPTLSQIRRAEAVRSRTLF